MRDLFFMEQALEEAKKARGEDEVPVGAVLVSNGEIVARAYNQVEGLKDATKHAEIVCIRKGSLCVKKWRLTGMTLYTTLEPCAMCLGALFLARVERVVFGAKDLRHGACGSWVNLLEKEHPTHQLQVEGGVCEAESAKLLQDFFKEKRKRNGSRKI